MITIICGKPRVGKTALNTCFARWEMQINGNKRLQRCVAALNTLSEEYGNKLVAPSIAPIYTNYDARFNIGYRKSIEPFRVNPFYLGLSNANVPIQYIAPYGELHITEGQRYWDSRESSTLPDHVSRWFETHGHFHLDIYIDVQRAKLIDKNIRALAKKIIEVQKMVHVKDVYGRILRTIWYCKEFKSSGDYETYEDGGYAPYVTTRYINEGNIFDSYNSRSCESDFVPRDGNNFTYPKQLSGGDIQALPDNERMFYMTEMPKWFRRKNAGKENGDQDGK